jgi:transcriptional regulator with XRE-family HTH domain
MARGAGLDRSAIVRIELGRAPLKYKAALAILRFLDAHPVWVATGHGSAQPGVPMPLASDLGVDDNASFSEVFDAHFSKYFGFPSQSAKADSSEAAMQLSLSASIRHDLIGVLNERLKLWFRQVPDTSLMEFMQSLVKCGDLLIVGFGRDDWKEEFARRGRMDALDSTVTPPHGGGGPKQAKNNLLTYVTVSDNVSPVKSIMANLLDRLNKATSQRGMKSKLAKVMGVPLANVSQWLSGAREPGGGTTLKLLHWVEQHEPQQNTLDSADNTAKGKATRRKVVYDKKPTSSHKQE